SPPRRRRAVPRRTLRCDARSSCLRARSWHRRPPTRWRARRGARRAGEKPRRRCGRRQRTRCWRSRASRKRAFRYLGLRLHYVAPGVAMGQVQRVCIVGGGAAGVSLAWSLAKASQLGLNRAAYDVTLVHDGPNVGGHSLSGPVTLGGQSVRIDCGVQMIAPPMYPLTLSMLALPEFQSVQLAPVDLRIACAFPGTGPGTVQYWGNFGAYRSTPLGASGVADCQTFQNLLTARPSLGFGLELAQTVQTFVDDNAAQFTGGDPSHFETYFLDGYLSIMNGYGNALLGTLLVGDLAPLFDLGYASFTGDVTGYARFKNGADGWVQQMWGLAQTALGTAI